jgi:GNAT superfamily N-acetyltransferase
MGRFGPGYLEQAALTDGTPFTLRSIRESDAPALQQGLAKLSPRSRYFRFLGPRSEFSDAELRHLSQIDWERHIALGVLVSGQLVAVGRFYRSESLPCMAEVALVVVDPLQHKGIGTLLLERLGAAAAERGITRFNGYVLVENDPMLRLLRKVGARFGLPSLGVYEPSWAV